MNDQNAPRGIFQLGLIATFALTLAAFEWKSTEWSEPAGWAFNEHDLLEVERIPVHLPSKPKPPAQASGVMPDVSSKPASEPTAAILPKSDPLAGKLHSFGFIDDGGGDEEIETVLLAEHMPHFVECEDVLDRSAERQCSEAEMISLIQRCSKFPRHLREMGIGGVVYLQFNVNEFGEVTAESVLKSAHPDLDQSALAALECIPQMVPGSQQGKPVRVTYTIPVRFTIR